jgi:hypothetical protein
MIHHEPEGVINHTDKMGACPWYMLYIKHNCLRSIYWTIFPILFLDIKNPYSNIQLTQ